MKHIHCVDPQHKHRRMTVFLFLATLALAGCSAESKPPSGGREPAAGATQVPAARVEGEWKIILTVTRLTGALPDRREGDVLERRWTFRPTCASGACDLILRRTTPEGIAVTTRLTFDGRVYRAEERGQRILCSGPRPTGPDQRGAIYEQGLEVRLAIEFHVEALTSKNATDLAAGIAGTYIVNFVPTAEAEAGGCTAFEERGTLAGARVEEL